MDFHRRSFFRTLFGLPAVAAVAAALPEPARAAISQPAWLVAEGQVENYEAQWAQANRQAMPFLTYKEGFSQRKARVRPR
jgi:hypothetical protein